MTATTPPSVACRVCGSPAHPGKQIEVRGHPATLHTCATCGLCFFPDPFWLDAAYADPIAEVDIGLPSRCVNLARVLEAVVRGERLGDRPHLDYGGGYGLMTRLARDRGLDVRHYDPYTKNLFAHGLDASLDRDYGCISLVEVLEHLTDPVELITSLADHCELILISTILVPPGMTDISQWWYVFPDIGQHITFYTETALATLADTAGLRLTTNHRGVHLLHRRPLRLMTRLTMREIRLSLAVGPVLRRRDRAGSLRDHDAARLATELAARTRQHEQEPAAPPSKMSDSQPDVR